MVSGLGRQLLDALLDPAEGFLLPQDLAQFYGATTDYILGLSDQR